VKKSISRLALAIRIRKAVYPALSDRKLFTRQPGLNSLAISENFHIASAVSPIFMSFSVWPILNQTGLSPHPIREDKVMNLIRMPDGSFILIWFRRGDWERDLLRYVSAPLGLLTIRSC
jgi:hypothetical protein